MSKNYSPKNIMFAPGGVTLPLSEYIQELKHPLQDISYILFLGRIVKEKRCDLLLSAFQSLQDKINIDLVIAGPLEDECIVSPYYNNKRIHVLGPVFGDRKNAFIKYALIYVLPSDLEGLSISLLEAMSYGCLCIASDIPANKEALGETGLYFKKGDGADLKNILYESIINYQKYNYLRVEAQNRIKTMFDWKILTENIIHFYTSILRK